MNLLEYLFGRKPKSHVLFVGVKSDWMTEVMARFEKDGYTVEFIDTHDPDSAFHDHGALLDHAMKATQILSNSSEAISRLSSIASLLSPKTVISPVIDLDGDWESVKNVKKDGHERRRRLWGKRRPRLETAMTAEILEFPTPEKKGDFYVKTANPAMLAFARKPLSLEEAAKKANMSVETLLALEKGEAAPTLVMLETLSRIYCRPLVTFFLAKPPVTVGIVDLRCKKTPLSPAMNALVRNLFYLERTLAALGEKKIMLCNYPTMDSVGIAIAGSDPERGVVATNMNIPHTLTGIRLVLSGKSAIFDDPVDGPCAKFTEKLAQECGIEAETEDAWSVFHRAVKEGRLNERDAVRALQVTPEQFQEYCKNQEVA